MKHRSPFFALALVMLGIILAACGGAATETPAPPTEQPAITPAVTVSDQDASGGTVIIDEVVAAEPGWLVIHIDNEGAPGPVIGYSQVSVGVNTDVEVEIDLAQATPQLFAMLHLDAGVAGQYEFPGEDGPVSVDGAVVNVPFNVTLPPLTPSVSVSDQETSGVVVIDEVVAAEAGWLVIHIDQDGAPGPVIGYTQVSVGVNTDVEVEIDLAQATPTLHAMLHLDAGTLGEYEFPGDDAPVKVGDAIVMAPFNVTIQEASASSAVTIFIRDAMFSESALTIPVGTTVLWVYDASLPHTVTSDDGWFDSGTLGAGASFQFTFNQVGTFAYHCEFHGSSGGVGMSGTITVTA